MRSYTGAHLHPDYSSFHQNRCIFRFSSDANRSALQVLIQIIRSQLQVSQIQSNSGSLFPIDDTHHLGNRIKCTYTVVHCRQLIAAIITPTCQYRDCCCVQLITEISSTSVISMHTLIPQKHLKYLPVYLY